MTGSISRADLSILDGGIGTEIQRRGFKLSKNTWSAFAHWENPDMVQQIHIDYIESGADVITTNTFSTAKHLLKTVNLKSEFENINRAAVKVAKNARDLAQNKNVLIAGSISTIPDLEYPDQLPVSAKHHREFRNQAALLVNEGVDILLAEMMINAEATKMIIDACSEFEIPVWVGLSASKTSKDDQLMAFRTPGKYLQVKNETFRNLVKAVVKDNEGNIDKLGIMHTKTPYISEALNTINNNWDGGKMAYAQIGTTGDHDWKFENLIPVEEYTNSALDWIQNHGVDVVGGCCGTSPEYVQAIYDALEP